MASIVISGDTSGAVTLAAPAVAGTTTLTLPATTGTLVVTSGAQTIEFADGTVSAPSITNSGDTNTGIFFPAADTIAFTEGGVESMRIDSSGNVGIGTTSPAANLHVRGGSGAAVRVSNIAGTTYTSILNDGIYSTGTDLYIFAPSTYANIFYAGGSERMRIDSSGNVGIGTSSPNTTAANRTVLDVNGTTSALYNISTGGTRRATFYSDSTDCIFGSVTSIPLEFLTGAVERMRITSDGYITMGTTNTNIEAGPGFKFIATTNAYIGMVVESSTNSQTNYHLYSTGAGTYRFYVGAGGTISATATTITAISDIRLKENIRDIDVGLDALMALRPRKFDWKEGKGKDKKGDRGWIAQEFETVFPDMIDEWKDEPPEGEEPYKAVNADLIPVLVKAIQEQQAIIEELKARIETLEAK